MDFTFPDLTFYNLHFIFLNLTTRIQPILCFTLFSQNYETLLNVKGNLTNLAINALPRPSAQMADDYLCTKKKNCVMTARHLLVRFQNYMLK